MADTLPRKLTPRLLEFCNTIAPGSVPYYVPSRPSPDAKFGECFNNVARAVERGGGTVVYGWAVWHLPGLVFEAEHHGVWRTAEGELVDVTPQINSYPQILFLADAGAVYDPHGFRSNMVAADNDDPRAQEFARLTRDLYAVRARYRVPGVAMAIARFDATDQLRCELLETRCRELVQSLGIQF